MNTHTIYDLSYSGKIEASSDNENQCYVNYDTHDTLQGEWASLPGLVGYIKIVKYNYILIV